jgi:conjugal transfer pilus assembly protein TraD
MIGKIRKIEKADIRRLRRRMHKPPKWTDIGEGINLDDGKKLIKLRIPEKDRKGHFWCFGTTRIGKTRLLEHIIEQDIRKGYSVVCIDPKGDIDLFSKITQVAIEAGRTEDLILVTPIFPELSAVVDPLSSYYMPEELVAHITAGVAVGKEPYFQGVAYEVSLVVVQALMELAKNEGRQAFFNLLNIKNQISHGDLVELKEKVDRIDTPEAEQIALDLQKILDSTPDYYSKVASSLRVALTELTTGNIGKIIGEAEENRFIDRLEAGKRVIMVVQLGSLLTKKASYTAGKVVVSMLQSFIGRRLASGKKVIPPLALHIDEAQSILYQGIEDVFAKAGGADIFVHGYSQSINQIHAEVGRERGNSILDNCNTKVFMRVPDAITADFVSVHLGEKRVYSPLISLGGGLAVRETEDKRIKVSDVLNLGLRQFYLITYSGTYKGHTANVPTPNLAIIFPDVAIVQAESEAAAAQAEPGAVMVQAEPKAEEVKEDGEPKGNTNENID